MTYADGAATTAAGAGAAAIRVCAAGAATSVCALHASGAWWAVYASGAWWARTVGCAYKPASPCVNEMPGAYGFKYASGSTLAFVAAKANMTTKMMHCKKNQRKINKSSVMWEWKKIRHLICPYSTFILNVFFLC